MRHVIPDELEARTLAALEEECCGALFIRSNTETNVYFCKKCQARYTQADIYREAMNREDGFKTIDLEERRAAYQERRAATRAKRTEEMATRVEQRTQMEQWLLDHGDTVAAQLAKKKREQSNEQPSAHDEDAGQRRGRSPSSR